MRAAFEIESELGINAEGRAYIKAIAHWINVRGFDRLREGIESGEIADTRYSCGPLYHGTDTVDRKRWNWWCEQFTSRALRNGGDNFIRFANTLKEFEDV